MTGRADKDPPLWLMAIVRDLIVQSHSLFSSAQHGTYLDPSEYQKDIDTVVRHYARKISTQINTKDII
jgi:hypothetical protein